ncbi:hypothetical protein CHUAL_006710 [Chamberlinius hualienensis]
MSLTKFYFTFALIFCVNAEFNNTYSKCMNRLKQNNITPKAITYDQLVKVGYVRYQSYCRVEINQRHPYKCANIQFLPKSSYSDKGTMAFGITFDLVPVATNFTVEVTETNTTGVFYICEKMTGVDGRIMAVLDAAPGFLVIFLCSDDAWEYNDFVLYRGNISLTEPNPKTELKPYVTSSTCNYFNLPQTWCPIFTVPITPKSLGDTAITLENIYTSVMKLLLI